MLYQVRKILVLEKSIGVRQWSGWSLGVSVKPAGLIKHRETSARLLDATIFRKRASPEVVEQ